MGYISREQVVGIIQQWFPGDSINNDKWAGKGILKDINALPCADVELERIKSGGEYICSCGLRKFCNHDVEPGF